MGETSYASYAEALSACLWRDDDGRREYLAGIETPTLRGWKRERGKPLSWCEVFRELIVAELDRRAAGACE